MKRKRKFFVNKRAYLFIFLLLPLLVFSTTSKAAMELKEDSLPSDWILTGLLALDDQESLARLESNLGIDIESFRNYHINAAGIPLQVNILKIKTKEDADKLYKLLVDLKGPEMAGQEKNLVWEYICPDPETVKKAKDLLVYSIQAAPTAFAGYDYLAKNQKIIKSGDGEIILPKDLLADSLVGKRLFLTGEHHGLAINQTLELAFLKYFQEHAQVKYLLMETPYSSSQLINEYLAGGDESYLDQYFAPVVGTYAWTKENYNFLRQLYAFNQTLPPDKRIQAIGIDIEHQEETAINFLLACLPAQKAPLQIQFALANLKSVPAHLKLNPKRVRDIVEELAKDIDKYPHIYEEYLSDNFFAFHLVADNICNKFVAYDAKDSPIAGAFNDLRDKMIYENFQKVYPRLPAGNFFGQWGLNHIFQKRQGNTDWVASLMNQTDSPLHNKILSIAYIYLASQRLERYLYKAVPIHSTVNKDLAEMMEGNLVLINLTEDGSPFAEDLIWFLSELKPAQGVTTDYFQYILLIKGAEPSTPLR